MLVIGCVVSGSIGSMTHATLLGPFTRLGGRQAISDMTLWNRLRVTTRIKGGSARGVGAFVGHSEFRTDT